ncbi:hypothetical protein J437_LFUL004215 [Ladona fulva]|uniref:Reverse transcriptase domain-containing protein n=1 Tax=Ladona fulva TaxID=123851 RepID=A0A8K0NYI6_LADFU|nr:hypothetical protein J437_LFUL004215 [Ladona fulva]
MISKTLSGLLKGRGLIECVMAFNGAYRSKLLSKLCLRCTPLHFIQSNLSERYQCVSVKYYLYGVPQGFALGPYLYLIYMNDVGYSYTVKVFQFADDTAFFSKRK